MRTDSQTKMIKAALENGAALTPLDALERFGCFRLGARIKELRDAGMAIETRMVKRGEARVAEYRLVTSAVGGSPQSAA